MHVRISDVPSSALMEYKARSQVIEINNKKVPAHLHTHAHIHISIQRHTHIQTYSQRTLRLALSYRADITPWRVIRSVQCREEAGAAAPLTVNASHQMHFHHAGQTWQGAEQR